MKYSVEEQQVLEQTMEALRQARTRLPHFECRPRYCGGSPALVPIGTCVHEAVDEKEAHARCLTGVFGEENKAKAEKLGLKGICFARWQKGKKVFRYDLITGETFEEPKRMSWDDKDHLRCLRKTKEYGICRWTPDMEAELADLEMRADIHRETV